MVTESAKEEGIRRLATRTERCILDDDDDDDDKGESSMNLMQGLTTPQKAGGNKARYRPILIQWPQAVVQEPGVLSLHVTPCHCKQAKQMLLSSRLPADFEFSFSIFSTLVQVNLQYLSRR